MMRRFLLAIVMCVPPIYSGVVLESVKQQGIAIPRESRALQVAVDGILLAANQPGLKECAVSVIQQGVLFGIAPENVYFNNSPTKIKNPLYDQAISFIETSGLYRTIVTQADPRTVYCWVTIEKVLGSGVLNDSDGKECSRVALISPFHGTWLTTDRHLLALVERTADDRCDLALIKNGTVDIEYEDFVKDDDGKVTTKKEMKKRRNLTFSPIDAQTGTEDGNRALPQQAILDAININGGLGTCDLHSIVFCAEQHRDSWLVGVHATTRDDAHDDQGICGVLLAYLDEKGCLRVKPMVPHQALLGEHCIIGATGPNKRVAIHAICTMQAHNGLSYMIVVGGNAHGQDTRMQVYALPLKSQEAVIRNMGTDVSLLAARDQTMLIRYHTPASNLFKGRYLPQSAQSPDALYTDNEQSVCVGGKAQLPGPITDIHTIGDAVFVSVAESTNNMQPGIFYSQAIIDSAMRIVAWTAWERAAGTVKPVYKFSPEQVKGSFTYLSSSNIPECSGIVFATDWFVTQAPHAKRFTVPRVETLFEQQFLSEQGGMLSLTDIPLTTPGLANNSSLLVATGLEKVLLIQTSARYADNRIYADPTVLWHKPVLCSDGSLGGFHATPPEQRTVLSISGGVVRDIGPVTCAHIVSSADESWLVIGGMRGLAVLADEKGHGWSTATGMLPNFTALRDTMSFKRIGNQQDVVKIQSNGSTMFVLTRKSLERAQLNAHLICQQTVPTTVIASPYTVAERASFSDCIIADYFAMLGTSQGLFVTSKDSNIFSDAVSDIAWRFVTLPDQHGGVVRLNALSITHDKADCVYNGQLYVICASAGTNKSSIHRLFIPDIIRHGITEQTPTLIDEQKAINTATNHRSLAGIHKVWYTDGTYPITDMAHDPAESGAHAVRFRDLFKNLRLTDDYQLPLVGAARNIVRDSATGRLIMWSDKSFIFQGDFSMHEQAKTAEKYNQGK